MDLVAQMKGSSLPLLWDGGFGTELISRGLDLSTEPPEAWLHTCPGEVEAVHREFAEAGADVLQTNTFGLPRLMLNGWGAARSGVPSAEACVPLSVRLAMAGAGRQRVALVGSLGPTGQGQPDAGQIAAVYETLARAFVQAGVGTIHLETFYQPDELRAALRGVRAGSPRLRVLCSVTLNLGNSGLETPMGTPLAYMLRVMDQEGPDAIGVNCSQNARRMQPSVEALVRWAGASVPVLAQPQVDREARSAAVHERERNGPECKWRTRAETDEQFVQGLQRLLQAGARAVGGCCGCSPAYIRAMRAALDASAAARPGPAAQAQ